MGKMQAIRARHVRFSGCGVAVVMVVTTRSDVGPYIRREYVLAPEENLNKYNLREM
jgi:hypothetical protein